MNEARVLIADADEDYRLLMGELIEDTPGLCLIGGAGSTGEALDILRRQGADLILMDLLLPGCDGVFLLEQLRDLDIKPAVVVNTSFLSPVIAGNCSRHSVSAILQKPSRAETVLERLLSVWEYRKEHMPKPVRIYDDDGLFRRKATDLMHELGYSSQYKGFEYLRQVLVSARAYGHVTRGTLKMVYADAARACGVSVGGMERAIRTMVKSNPDAGESLGIRARREGFTNMEMIAMLDECLRDNAKLRQKIV